MVSQSKRPPGLAAPVPGDEARAAVVRPGVVCALLTTTTLIGFTTNTMVAPLLLDLAAAFDVSVAVAGQLAAATSLLWAIGSPIGGLIVDRYGRRPLLIGAVMLTALATGLGALAPSFGFLFAARMLSGVAGTVLGPSVLTTAGEVFPAGRRGTYLGWVMSGFSLALVVGAPAMAFVGGLCGWRWSFATMAVLLGLLAGAHALFLPRLPRSGSASQGALGSYRIVLGNPQAVRLLAFNTCERISYATVTIYFASFLMLSYAMSTAAIAPVLPFVALGGLLGTWLGGRLADRLPPPALLIACQLAAGIVALPLMVFAPGLALSVALGAAFGLLNAGSRAPMMALAAQVTTPARGTLMGLVAMTNHAGLVLGTLIGGACIALVGFPALSALCGLSAFAAALFALAFRRRGSTG